jgi:O-antigen ligase
MKPSQESSLSTHPKGKTTSIIFLFLCGYLFLFIERPWEVWSQLAPYRIERIYMIVAIGIFVVFSIWREGHIRWGAHPFWVTAFLALHYALAPLAFNQSAALDQAFEYFKMAVFYFLVIWSISSESQLQRLIQAYIGVMGLYMVHSFREYLAGRHLYRMGMMRMVGVDQFANDPNTFAGSLVLSLPFLWLLFRTEGYGILKWSCLIYFGLALTCIVLTGSRAGFLSLVVFIFLIVGQARGKRLFFAVVAALLLGLAGWQIMPEDKRLRIETIWDPQAGPASAQRSTEGRIEGLKAGLRMLAVSPLTGVGAGGANFIQYRVAMGDGLASQAHNLAGELLGEMGLVGGLVFVAQVITAFRAAGRTIRLLPSPLRGGFEAPVARLAIACRQSLVLLLFSGLFGHNLYRVNWLWIGAWSFLALRFAMQKNRVSIPGGSKKDFPPFSSCSSNVRP